MMMSEFTERTKYEPSFKEYAEIEEAYYEFDGNKDEFCKAWLKDKKSGAWDKECELRKRIRMQDEMINELRENLKSGNETIQKFIEERWGLWNKVEELTVKIEKYELNQPTILYTALA